MRLLGCFAFLASLASAAALHAQAGMSPDSSGALFTRLILDRTEARRTADTAAYRRFADPAAVYLGDDGSRKTLDQRIHDIASDGVEDPLVSRGMDSLHVAFAGGLALVDYWGIERARLGSRNASWAYRESDTYVERSGHWLLLRHTETHALASPHPVAVPAATLDDYVGRYEWWPGYEDTITRVGDQLFDQITGDAHTTMNQAATPEAFFIASDPSLLVIFVRDSKGLVTGYVLHYPDGQVVSARKVK